MIFLLATLLLGSPSAAPAWPEDPCKCGGCLRYLHLAATGDCRSCKGQIGSMTDSLCAACGRSQGRCTHCGKPLKNDFLAIGKLSLVDKQPRRDMVYHVLETEDGRTQGIYLSSEMKGERVLVWGSNLDDVTLFARSVVQLKPKDQDLKVTGPSDTSVGWRLGCFKGGVVHPQDGTYTMMLPAAEDRTFEITSGPKVLRKFRYSAGEWTEIR